MSSPKTRTTPRRAPSRSALRERRIVYTAEALFVQSISNQGDGYAHVDYYATEALKAAHGFWDKVDQLRTKKGKP